MMRRFKSYAVAAMLLIALAPAAAQLVDPRTCVPGTAACDSARREKSANDAAYEEAARQQRAEWERQRRALLNKPPLPAESNALLGSWRLADGQRSSAGGLGRDTGRGGLTDIVGALSSMNLEKIGCELSLGGGISFAPSTYTRAGVDGRAGGSIAYRSARSGAKSVIAAIPGDGGMMVFEVVSPDRIVDSEGCALVRVGATGAAAVANAAPAPGHARPSASGSPAPPAASGPPQVAAVAPSPPPSTLSRPSPEVCRNTLLDKLGMVGSNQVRAMSDVRFKEAAIEGKVPNSNNLRIDLRGSSCDDPRIKATLYDFDANEMLQSITYVWDRPAGPAPAPIFQERVAALSRFHSLPPPQSPGRLQADTSLGRLILEDLPDRNLLLEAYKAKN
jgi:hypothetical protein